MAASPEEVEEAGLAGSEVVQSMRNLRAAVEPPMPEFGSLGASRIRLGQLALEFGIWSPHHLQFILLLTLPSFPLPRWNPTQSCSLQSLSCPRTRT